MPSQSEFAEYRTSAELNAMFESRQEAAQRLAEKLKNLKGQNALVLGIPRGGVLMGRVIADAIEGELDILLVHKFTDPRHPELDLGSVTEDGEVYLNRSAQHFGYSEHDVEKAALEEIRSLQEQRRVYTPGSTSVSVNGRTVVMVDDGVGTGSLIVAAIRYLEAQGARRVILATPVASTQAVRLLKESVDVCTLAVPDIFDSVNGFYRSFPQVSDEEVASALRRGLLAPNTPENPNETSIRVESGHVSLTGVVCAPKGARTLIVIAHASGSGRFNWRNQLVARSLEKAGLATLLIDLLDDEEVQDARNITNAPLLAHRLNMVTEWLARNERLSGLYLGYYGASAEAAAILQTAAEHPLKTRAVAIRGAEIANSQSYLSFVMAPTLLIAPGDDEDLIKQNRVLFEELRCEKRLQILPDAGLDFAEPGTSETVAELATSWFRTHLESSHREPVAAHAGA